MHLTWADLSLLQQWHNKASGVQRTMLYQLLKRNQVSLAIGSLPSPFVSKVADISEAIEHALEFCLNEIIPGADCPVCPHVAFIDTLNTFGSISELTAKVLNRYGINAIFSPGVHPVKR